MIHMSKKAHDLAKKQRKKKEKIDTENEKQLEIEPVEEDPKKRNEINLKAKNSKNEIQEPLKQFSVIFMR